MHINSMIHPEGKIVPEVSEIKKTERVSLTFRDEKSKESICFFFDSFEQIREIGQEILDLVNKERENGR